MTRSRVVETDTGIQGEFEVTMFDQMQRYLRDKGWIETKDIIKSGLCHGLALEIGPGPGYLGLEWLKQTQGTTLKGLDISPDMIALAIRNAKEYGLDARVEYIQSSAARMPFDSNYFDAVFSNGSLHEWSDPKSTFNEIGRILKPGGAIFLSDLRRDMNPLIQGLLWINTRPKEMRSGLVSSINAAYTAAELRVLIDETPLQKCMLSTNLIGHCIKGVVNK